MKTINLNALQKDDTPVFIFCALSKTEKEYIYSQAMPKYKVKPIIK